MNVNNFTPTAEQVEILRTFQDGLNLKIHAFAGTGKTTTLRYLAQNTDNKGLYIAFNNRVAKEAKKSMPDNMEVSTIHGVAWKWAIAKFPVKKLVTNPNFTSLQEAIQVPHIVGFSNYKSTATIAKVISRYCQSEDMVISEKHIPWHDIAYRFDHEILKENQAEVINAARLAWHKMLEPETSIGLGHDGYLKYWANSNPVLDYDFIFVDEAQDLSPVMLEVINNFPKQKIIVGDSQQQIYEWRGAIDAMQHEIDAHDCFLTTTFRFGENVANLANNVLTALGVERKIISQNASGTTLTHDLSKKANAILFRTNAGLIGSATEYYKANIEFHIVDPNNNIKESVEDYFRLNDGKWGRSQSFEGFNSWETVKKIAKEEETHPFRGFVDLFESFNPEEIRAAVDASKAQAGKTYPSLSTAHQAKGLEWDCVQIREGFAFDLDSGNSNEACEEFRLLYVALTRAKRELQISESLKEQLCCLVKKSNRFAVIDLETTGLSPSAGDRLTEIGIVIWEDGEIIDRFQSLINPQIPIPMDVQQLTGITNKMVKSAPKSEEVLPRAMSFVGGLPLVAHNASFERKFLNSELSRLDTKYEVDLVCTMLTSRRFFPNLKGYKLGDLVREFSLPKGQAHRALSDAEMTAHLLSQIQHTFCSSVKNNEAFSADALLQICKGTPKQFRENGIEAAISFCLGKYSSEKYHSFDFSKLSIENEITKDSIKVGIEKNCGKVLSIPISTETDTKNSEVISKRPSRIKTVFRRLFKTANFLFFGVPLLATTVIFFTEDQKTITVILGLILLGMWFGIQKLINHFLR